jgi:hypothetical protein
MDEYGRPGRYSGYVDDEHRPHGDGALRYEDGTEWEGAWHAGSQLHGKTRLALPMAKKERARH